jgi:hypothetical protein
MCLSVDVGALRQCYFWKSLISRMSTFRMSSCVHINFQFQIGSPCVVGQLLGRPKLPYLGCLILLEPGLLSHLLCSYTKVIPFCFHLVDFPVWCTWCNSIEVSQLHA